jgi:outer membrane immunogenic protein
MKNTLAIGAAALSLAAVAAAVPADAADIYRRDEAPAMKESPAAMRWQGPYIGAHIGGAWADFATRNVNAYPDLATSTKQAADGVFGGGQLGYNLQRDRLVFGVEADLGGMDISGRKVPDAANFPNARASIGSGFYGDITGRVGIAADRALIYGKAGYAWYDGAAKFTDTGALTSIHSTGTFGGWAAGGGAEYMLRPNWSLKAEYMHFDFGRESSRGTDANSVTYRFSNDLTVDTVKAGVNYHFTPNWSDPLK